MFVAFIFTGIEMPFTTKEKAFCVLEYARTQSNKTVQRAFVREFSKKSPTGIQIWTWHKKFKKGGCLCRAKGFGRLQTSEEVVERVRENLVRSPKKSIRRTSLEVNIPPTTVWRVLKKRLLIKPYKLQLVQAITADDKKKRKQFCIDMQEKLEEDEFRGRFVFSDEATFHTNGKVNKHNVRIWGEENPHVTVEHERDSPKVNVFCAISKNHVHGPSFFEGNVTGDGYLEMLQNWLMDELIANEHEYFILQQDGAPPHRKITERAYLNDNLRGRWIGRAGVEDSVLLKWPPHSPHLTLCDFLLWGYVKGIVYVPLPPANPEELKQRIIAALGTVTQDMLERVWEELDYRLDVYRVSSCAHIEHL